MMQFNRKLISRDSLFDTNFLNSQIFLFFAHFFQGLNIL